MNIEKLQSYFDTPKKALETRIVLMSSFDLYLKFMFFAQNEINITIKPFHKKVITALEKIAFGENEKRNLLINIPVGCGKSTLIEYWISWCYARDINNAFLYLSHSADLIQKFSKEIQEIVASQIWQTIFDAELNKTEKAKINWSFEDAADRSGLRALAIGSGITGMDAGRRGVDYYTGALVIDDPNDVKKIRYALEQDETIRTYDDKLKTRRRNTKVPTILIMQRLNKNDLSAWALDEDDEEWEHIIIPVLDENDVSIWEKEYPAKDMISMRDSNPFKFYSQYMQSPITSGGSVIKPEWFNYYPTLIIPGMITNCPIDFNRLFMTADTAQKTKEHNDYTVFCVWGVDNANLYLLDLLRGKWEAPDLLRRATEIWNKWKIGVNGKLVSGMYVEDKSSGTGLIQTLTKESRIPIIAVQRIIDKLTRVEDQLPTIESGRVYLPLNSAYGFNPILLSECEGFTRDMSHKHDDIVDNISDGCNIFNTGYTQEDLM